jgi:MFS family permease
MGDGGNDVDLGRARFGSAKESRLSGDARRPALLLKTRNIRFTMMLATLNMTLYVGLVCFLPLYLVNVLGLSSSMMGVVATAQAAVMVVLGFLGPTLYDRFGRRPTIIGSFLLAMLGAGAMPVAIGWAADRFGLGTLPWILIVVAGITCLVTLGLRETAPRLVARSA